MKSIIITYLLLLLCAAQTKPNDLTGFIVMQDIPHTYQDYFSLEGKNVFFVSESFGWCRPCQTAKQDFLRLKQEVPSINLYFFDVDQITEPKLAEQLNIWNIPTIIFYKNGTLMYQKVYDRSEAEYERIKNLEGLQD